MSPISLLGNSSGNYASQESCQTSSRAYLVAWASCGWILSSWNDILLPISGMAAETVEQCSGHTWPCSVLPQQIPKARKCCKF